jgi:hypothetical protein
MISALKIRLAVALSVSYVVAPTVNMTGICLATTKTMVVYFKTLVGAAYDTALLSSLTDFVMRQFPICSQWYSAVPTALFGCCPVSSVDP